MNNKKKIGVLTFHNGPNFGGYMQAWHMVNAVRELGYDCCAVNYLHKAHDEGNQIKIPLKSIAALKGKIFWALKSRPFKGIGDTICEHPYTTNEENVPWSEFDAFIVGSDIVWDYQDPHFGNDPAYFGMLEGQKEIPIASYAASCGPASPDGPFPNYVKNGLKRFKNIGVRDPATASLVKNASGRNSTIVVDPTWLADDPEIEWARKPSEKYVFVYGGKVDEKLGPALRSYCDKRGLELVSALTSCRWANKTYRSLHPFQWVELFKNAEATAIVGTLHGTLFSIKYNKPFILINGERIAPKITEVMNRSGQGFRVFNPGEVGVDELRILDCDEAEVPKIPEDWKASSLEFLKQALASG